MSIHCSACLKVVLVQLVINGTHHLSLGLVCIIVGSSWSKSAVWDNILQQGAIPEALVVQVRCVWQSPPTRGSSWGPSGRILLCETKSSNEGQFCEALIVEVCFARQSPLTRGRSLRPLQSKSAMRDKVLRQGVRGKLWGLPRPSPLRMTKTSIEGQASRQNVKFASTKISPPTRGRIWGTRELVHHHMHVKPCHHGYLARDITHGLTHHDIP